MGHQMTSKLKTLKSFVRPHYMLLAMDKTPLRLEEDASPIFIIGSGRSGNTLIRRILTAGPELYIPPETYVLGQIIRRHLFQPRINWEDLCQLTIGTFATSEDSHMFPTCEMRPLFEKLMDTPVTERSLARIVCEFYKYMMQQAKTLATRWGDKTPMNSGSLPQIDRMFPQAKYVHIVRDGYDVVASYLNMGRYSCPLEAAGRWVQATNDCHAFAEARPHRVIEIRYEDLCTDPERVTTLMCNFFNLAYSKQMIHDQVDAGMLGDIDKRAHYANVTQPVGTASIGKGRRELGSSIVNELRPILSDQMAKLGYT